MDADTKDVNKKKTDWMTIIALGIAVVALILAIFAFFVGKGSQGPTGATGATGPTGPQGNNGTNVGAIITGQTQAIYDTNKKAYVLPPIYNGYNIVIPEIISTSPYFIIDASDVQNGDVFTIDNTNNPSLFLYIQVPGFDNVISADSEVVLNSGSLNNGRNNTALVNITTGKTDSTTNIFIFINSY
jgi:hypothetical protein